MGRLPPQKRTRPSSSSGHRACSRRSRSAFYQAETRRSAACLQRPSPRHPRDLHPADAVAGRSPLRYRRRRSRPPRARGARRREAPGASSLHVSRRCSARRRRPPVQSEPRRIERDRIMRRSGHDRSRVAVAARCLQRDRGWAGPGSARGSVDQCADHPPGFDLTRAEERPARGVHPGKADPRIHPTRAPPPTAAICRRPRVGRGREQANFVRRHALGVPCALSVAHVHVAEPLARALARVRPGDPRPPARGRERHVGLVPGRPRDALIR